MTNRLFLSVAMLLIATGAFAQARASYSTVTQDDVKYRVYYNDGYAYVYGIGTSTATDITIADSVTYNNVNYPVTYINSSAFSGNDVLVSVTIEEGLTQILSQAFYDCDALVSITLPSTLDTIGSSVFYDCASLDSVEIPEGVTGIGESVFYNCDALTSITLPSTLSSIGASCFRYCDALTSISWPKGVVSLSLGNYCFDDCDALTSISLPEGLVSLGNYCFRNCDALTSISLPEGLVSLGSYCFYDCDALDSLWMPSTLTSIGSSCFSGCDNLEYVQVDATTPPSISSTSVFPDYFYPIVVPQGSAETYYNTSYWSSFTIINGERLSLTIDVSTAGSLADLVLAQTENYRDVIDLKLTGTLNDDDLSTIQNYLTKLLTLDLGETDLTELPGDFLKARYNIEHIVLPAELDTITGTNAFNQCRNLRDVEIPGSLAYIPSYTFRYCTKLDSVTFNEGLIGIGNYAFYEDASLSYVTLPSTVVYLSSFSFGYCTGLKDVSLNEGLRRIYSYSFCGDTSLKSLTLPSTVLYLEDRAFEGCTGLKDVSLNEGLAVIMNRAFSGCTGLTEVTLPSTLLLCERPFYSCDNLTSLTCLAAVPPATNGYWPLSGTDAEGKTLYVPSMLITEYKQASGWDSFTNIKVVDGDYEPEQIGVINEMLFTSSARPSNTPDVTLYSYDYFYSSSNALTNYWTAGHMSVDEGETFSMGTFSSRARRESYKYDYYDARYPTLISNTAMRADSVETEMTIYDNQWFFVSFPYDVQVSSIVEEDAADQWVVRKYDGEKRAAGLTDSTWVNMTADSVLSAGQGYIIMTDGSETYSSLLIPALNNTNKNNIFAYTDQTVTLTEYTAEYSHNRSWNLVGNPFPCFYDTRYMEFAAPITVWNGTGYTAYSLTDDSYVLKPFEAFFVQKPVDDTETMVFTTEGRQHTVVAGEGPSEAKSRVAAASDRYVVNLTVSCDDYEDRTRVVLNEAASCDYELSCDAAKFMSSSAAVPQLWSTEADGDYAINERPLAEGLVALGFKAGTSGTYTLAMPSSCELSVTLNDLYEGTTTLLNSGSYTFDSSRGTFTDRFSLTFAGETTGIRDVQKEASESVLLSVAGGQLSIAAAEGTSVAVYAPSGALIGRTSTGAASYDVAPGIYIVNVAGESRKVIVSK